MMAVHCTSDGSGCKTREMLICEGLRGRYSGREHAYIMSPSKAIKFEKYVVEGWVWNQWSKQWEPPNPGEQFENLVFARGWKFAASGAVDVGYGILDPQGDTPAVKMKYLERETARLKREHTEWNEDFKAAQRAGKLSPPSISPSKSTSAESR